MNYSPIPFFHLNGELKEAETKRQMNGTKNVGYGGVALLPVFETKPEFLTEDYFTQYKYFLEEAKKLGMDIILYDDLDFPSGVAGRRVGNYPDLLAKALMKEETDIIGGTKYEKKLNIDGYLCSAALNLETKETFDLTEFIANNTLKWDVPTGKFKIISFYLEAKGHTAVFDYLNPKACEKFVEIALEPYYEKFHDYFGKTIKMLFTDDIAYYHTHNGKHWTKDFNEKFIKEHGFSPVKFYPALWYDIGENTKSAKYLLLSFRNDLLSEGFMKTESEWAKAKGIKATGHQSGSRHKNPAFLSGDNIKFLKHMETPGMDNIFGYRVYAQAYKMTASAAICFERETVMCETYGTSTPTEFEIISCLIEQFLKGINLVIPHGEWYDQQNVRIEPDLNYNSEKYGEILKKYNSLAKALAKEIRAGKTICEVGVVYPIETLLGAVNFDYSNEFRDYVHADNFICPEFVDYFDVGETLSNDIRFDFVYLHPEVLKNNCTVQKNEIILNNLQKLKIIILPSCKIISIHTMEMLKQFHLNGGIVINSGKLPSKAVEFGCDEKVCEIVKCIFGTNTDENFDKSNLINKIEKAGFKNEVTINCSQELSGGILSYIHKKQEDRQLYCFGNSSGTVAEAKIEIKADFNPLFFDINGNETDISFEICDGYLYFEHTFNPLTVLVVSDKKQDNKLLSNIAD